MATSSKMAEHLYKQSAGPDGEGPGAPGADDGTPPNGDPEGGDPGTKKKKDDENVIDADWSEAN